MTQRMTGLCAAAAVCAAVSLAAQTPTSTTTPQAPVDGDKTGHAVTVTGCVAKAADGQFMLTNAMVDPSAPAGTAGTTATVGVTPAGTTGGADTTSSITGAMTVSSNPAMTWMLSGVNDLDKHLGHKVQVTGRTTWDASKPVAAAPASEVPAATTAATAETTTIISRPLLDVRTVKMLTASCP